MRYPILLLLLALQGCAHQAPPLSPLVARKEGMTILIRRPFDCDKTTQMMCKQTSGLDYECTC